MSVIVLMNKCLSWVKGKQVTKILSNIWNKILLAFSFAGCSLQRPGRKFRVRKILRLTRHIRLYTLQFITAQSQLQCVDNTSLPLKKEMKLLSIKIL